MPKAIKLFVKYVDAFNFRIGRFAMYLLFVMMAILLWSSFSKTFFNPSLWTLEMAQFTLTAYYLLGGPYSMQMDEHVRMDLFYGSWTPETKAWVDAFTIFFLIFFLSVLLYGAYESTSYSLQYGERSATAWRPYKWPIKIIMFSGILLMLLQSVSVFFKDVAKIRGEEL
ncbi:MAG: C4-dicarboxylate ABC transporter [Hyphomicrobiales bacterium]|nr:MAG: C4-dicarboxylate ABC transporter [Hyphomicrobiales bacterium]